MVDNSIKETNTLTGCLTRYECTFTLFTGMEIPSFCVHGDISN